MASQAKQERIAKLNEYYRRNPHMRPADPLEKTARAKLAEKGASAKEERYERALAERIARMKKKPTTNVNKGGMPDLTGDGKVTQADVLKGRGVFMKGGMKKKRNANIDYRKGGMVYSTKVKKG